ncbi:shikimate kinase [Bacillaceae bacterium SIJ1]|uniref:shikimate kinase n=1 Tax=Litoribacterium kuwaitense TaxID=1398745 RepID=UPI0013EB45FB|nr:shikimate kinase [Litoribacterium kuwaitense]NGP43580.1 shikimate kinase [Litoribacterium kuwaitense]
MQPIFLTGFMGAGKTTVGQIIAEQLQAEFIDTDEEIEKQEKREIRTIFETEGEAYFRSVEAAVLRSVTKPATVLSTGGGIVLKEANRRWMLENGLWVFLECSLEEIERRLEDDLKRPLLKGNARERIQTLYKERLALYRQASWIVQADQGSPKEIASSVIDRIQNAV